MVIMATFHKKHYEKIAALFREVEYYTLSKKWIVNAFVDMFAEDDSNFDKAEFIKACKKGGE